MATAGSTAKPTTYIEYFGLNSVNQIANVVTLPAGGPWNITRLGVWLAGRGATARYRLCLWNSGGTLVRQTGDLSVASQAFALGNLANAEANITPYEVPGGTTVIVGYWRDPTDSVQNGYTGSGSHYHDTTGSAPSSLSGWSSHSGTVGAYLEYVAANALPTAPSLISPANNALTSDLTPVLDWAHNDPDGDAQVGRQIQVDEQGGAYASPVWDSAVTTSATSVTYAGPALVRGTTYGWRVRTKDAEGYGPWSATRYFTINSLPVAALKAPNDANGRLAHMVLTAGAGWSSPRMMVEWTFTDADGEAQTQYEVEVANDSSGAVGSYLYQSGPYTSPAKLLYVPATFVEGNYYHVRVRVKDASEWSAWSGWFRCRARWGLTTHRRDLTVAPLSWSVSALNTTVDSTKQAIVMEYNSSTDGSTLPDAWKSSLTSVTKRRWVHYRAYLFYWGTSPGTSPSFNDITISYTAQVLQPDHWLPNPLSGVGAAIEPGDRAFGSQSLSLAANGTTRQVTQDVVVEPDVLYVAQVRIKATGAPNARLEVHTSAGLLAATANATPDAGWLTMVTQPFNVGPTTVLSVRATVSGASGIALFDGAQIERGGVASPWTPNLIGPAIIDAGGVQIDAADGGVFRLRGSDGASLASLDANGLVGAVVPVEASPALKYGWTWYKVATTVAVGADTDTDVDSAFRVTYPGNPAMAGKKVIIRAWIDAGYTFSVANTETGLALFASVVPNDHASTRLRWQRQRYPATASVQQSQHLSHVARWNAEQVVEFKAMCRAAVAGSFLFYNATTAIYVSQIGYEVLGYSAT